MDEMRHFIANEIIRANVFSILVFISYLLFMLSFVSLSKADRLREKSVNTNFKVEHNNVGKILLSLFIGAISFCIALWGAFLSFKVITSDHLDARILNLLKLLTAIAVFGSAVANYRSRGLIEAIVPIVVIGGICCWVAAVATSLTSDNFQIINKTIVIITIGATIVAIFCYSTLNGTIKTTIISGITLLWMSALFFMSEYPWGPRGRHGLMTINTIGLFAVGIFFSSLVDLISEFIVKLMPDKSLKKGLKLIKSENVVHRERGVILLAYLYQQGIFVDKIVNYMHNIDLNYVNLSNEKLSGIDLTSANLSSSKLRKVDLSKTNLAGAKFNQATLKDTNLSQAKNIGQAQFNDIVMEDVEMDKPTFNQFKTAISEQQQSKMTFKEDGKTILVTIPKN